MKTQINKLISGTTHLGSHGVAGTDRFERTKIAAQVISENQEHMIIKLKEHEIVLKANWSLSRKSVHYSGSFPLDLYDEMFGKFGIPQNNAVATLIINGDMTINVYTNSKFRNSGKRGYQVISEQDIIII